MRVLSQETAEVRLSTVLASEFPGLPTLICAGEALPPPLLGHSSCKSQGSLAVEDIWPHQDVLPH